MFHSTYKRKLEPDNLAILFEEALGESPQYARKLAQGWRQYRTIAKGFWHQAATIPLDESIQRADDVTMQDEKVLQNFLNNHSQGIVLLTIHMGDYLHSILKILKLAKRRQVVILRRKSWSEEEQTAFGKIGLVGHNVKTVRHGPGASRTITKALRNGAIAVLLYDLPHQWGETKPVKLFNFQLHWVVGPLQLAMLGKAAVIPFYTYKSTAGWCCDLKPVRDYQKLNCDRKTFLVDELQAVTTMAEFYIRNNVHQWDHWNLLHDMAQGKET